MPTPFKGAAYTREVLLQTAAEWADTSDFVLKTFQNGRESDTGLEKVGDGVSTWAELDYAYQPYLVSGTNIKTVNGTSLLGSGNVNGGTPILSAILEADFSSSNQTLTAVPDLTLNLEAGHWYRVMGRFSWFDLEVSSQMDFGGGSVTATSVIGIVTLVSYADSSLVLAGLTGLTESVNGGADVGAGLSVDFTIQVNAAGTLIPRFARFDTSGFDNALLAGSVLQAVDITP